MSAVVQDLARAAAVAATPAVRVERGEAIKRARELLAPSMKDREAPAYPSAALGTLASPCEAIAAAGQVQPAMVGQCLLGAASLLTQGLFNVETLAGTKPLSLDLLTLGDSGDGILCHLSDRSNARRGRETRRTSLATPTCGRRFPSTWNAAWCSFR